MGNIKTSWKLGSGELRWIRTDLLCDRDSRGTKRAEKQHKKQKIKNIIRYPEKEKSKQKLRSNYTALRPQRVNGLLFQHAKIYSAGSKEISNTKDKC